MEKLVVSRDLLLKVAKNARVNLTEKEIQILLPQFEEILKTFSKVAEVDVKGVEPAFHPIEIKNVFRQDLVGKSLPRELALKNTLHKKDGYFKGPKVVG